MIRIIAFIVLYIITGCENKDSVKINEFDWLVGDWCMKKERGLTIENWSKEDNYLLGTVYQVIGSDTLMIEKIKLYQIEGNWIYEADVDNQNNSPIKFSMIVDSMKAKPKYLYFTNPDHDYPNIITYHLIAEDSLLASISDNKHIKYRKFGYRKFKNQK